MCAPHGEQWLPAAGYAGFYECSCCGAVYSLARATSPGGLLRPQLNTAGYRFVRLYKYGQVRSLTVARLVLATFTGPPAGRRARHGPGGKTDDTLPNLHWA